MQRSVPCMLMRGGTSKGLYFLGADLPAQRSRRDALLLSIMGSPDPRQIDGLGGAHPLTSKVAVVSPSARDDCDVDYLFLQVHVDRAAVSDTQNCGNILAGVGPFAIESGLVAARAERTAVRVRMLNSGARAVLRVQTPGAAVTYAGDARIDGVPGTAAPVPIEFLDLAGSSCGALLPSGRPLDEIDGYRLTCIDNGMPVVLLRAEDLGVQGTEAPAELEANEGLSATVEALRLQAGAIMGLGDVRDKTVPKMSLLSPPQNGGAVSTRTFIPHRVHEAIGVLGAVSVATGCLLPGSVAADLVFPAAADGRHLLRIEHPTGFFDVEIEMEPGANGGVRRAALLRTARLLMRGEAMASASAARDSQAFAT